MSSKTKFNKLKKHLKIRRRNRLTPVEIQETPIESNLSNHRAEDIYTLSLIESKYMKDIHEVVEEYISPIMEIVPETCSQVFLNFEAIYESQLIMHLSIQNLVSSSVPVMEKSVSSIFLDFDFGLYASYVSGYERAIATVVRRKKGDLKFRHILAKIENQRKPLLHMLTRPLSIILEYLAIIKSLLFHTEFDTVEYAKLYYIFDNLTPLVDASEPLLFVHDHQRDLKRICERVEGIVNLEHPMRYLIITGETKRQRNRKTLKVEYFLLNDRFIIARILKKRIILDAELLVQYMQIRLLGENSIEITAFGDSERYILVFNNQNERDILWNYMNELNIPVNDSSAETDIAEITKTRGKLWIKMETPETQIPIAKETNIEMRQNIIEEILHTEREYVEDLKIIIKNFLEPMINEFVIDESDIPSIFSHIRVILGVNESLLEELEEAYNEEDVPKTNLGPVFIKFADFLKVYTQYCANHQNAVELVMQYRKRAAFSEFEQETSNIPELRRKRLTDFLIKPIQRICKYPLLINELLKYTHESFEDHESLVNALIKLDEVASFVDEKKHQAEKSMILMKIFENISNLPKNYEFLTPTRILILENTLKKKSVRRIQTRHIWLFNDLIVYAKGKKSPFKYKGHLLLVGAFLRQMPPKSGKFSFQIFPHGSSKAYTFFCDSRNQLVEWVSQIQQSIDLLQELGISPIIEH